MSNIKSHYREALEELLFTNSSFGALAQALGNPIIDNSKETAYVTFEKDSGRIRFAVNETWFTSLTVDEAAGNIAHEAYHIVLEHLEDLKSEEYSDRNALITAHECLVNDRITDILDLPLGEPHPILGPETAGLSFSEMTTPEAYEILKDKESEKDSKKTPENNSDEGSAAPPKNSGSGQPCSGIEVSPEEVEAMNHAVSELIDSAAQDEGVSSEDFIDAILNDSDGGQSPGAGGSVVDASPSSAEMNWMKLLARINPKVLESGKRVKTRANWTRTNRRMISTYPKTVLPVREKVKPNRSKGDSKPVFVIALDQSSSIPRELCSMLQGLLMDIPEDLIEAYPITWADGVVEFDPENSGKIASGGTKIYPVVRYVEDISRKTGKNPYVLVITDGGYYPSNENIGVEWFHMAVAEKFIPTIVAYGHEKSSKDVYTIEDFRV